MKQMKTWLQHLRQCCALKGRKTGSSLGMVMIVGTALVIWVMAIMPLMTTTGTTAIKTQNTQDDYLTARSSIEFSKSELEKIVETQIPYTFAVLQDDNGKFSALPKKDGIITNPAYQACIVEDATDDTKDVPEAGDAGANVAAICAAKLNPEDSTQYLLTITTFTKCEKNLSYTAIYTLNGSLLIYPESYKQSQALPLSDFVLVDGKLGANEVWESDISGPSDTSFTETLLAWVLEPEDNYANSGEYPAVFKMTAQASGEGESIGEEIKEEPLTDEKWIKPTASTKDATDKVDGSMWIETLSGKVTVYMQIGGTKTDITSDCVIYYNGTERTTYPSSSGVYTISVDYEGTGTYDDEATANVLPINGVVLGEYKVASKKFDASSCEIEDVTYSSGSCTVELTNISGARYGYTTKADGSEITWGSSNEINVDSSKTYYFYCYCPAGFVDGIWYDDSDVKYAGMIFPFEAVTSLEHGGEYIVMATENNKYYSLNTAKGTTEYPDSNPVEFEGGLNAGVIFAQPADNLAWTMVKTDPKSSSSTWQFASEIDKKNEEIVVKNALKVTQTRSGSWPFYSYGYGLGGGELANTSTSKSNFSITIDQSAKAVVRQDNYKETEWFSEQNVTLYLKYSSGSISASKQSGNMYFIKMPVQGTESVATPTTVGDWDIDVSFDYNPNIYNWTKVKELVGQATSGAVVPTDLYVNGKYLTYDETINAGVYELVGYTAAENSAFSGGEYYRLGTLTVGQAPLKAEDYSITVEQDETDELKITLTGEGWNNDTVDAGVQYFGYKAVADDGSETEMNWFESNDDGTIEFRLNYGKYIFAMAESGSNNYSIDSYLQTEPVEIKAAYVDMTDVDNADFVYHLNRSDVNNVVATWYELPDKITPSKITMAYGIPTDEGGISWSTTYSSEVRFYGALIKGTDYETLPNVFQLSQPIGVTNENGHFSSMIKGSSLYFMGEGASINTYGNDIYVTADLLVLKNPITGGGRVLVYPYSTGDGEPGDTLAFFVTNIGNFVAKNFYRIPNGTDLNNVSATQAAAWKVVDEDGEGTVGTTFADAAKYFFRNKVYPEINLDIAYASKEQLSRIVSGETIGWVQSGVLQGDDSDTNTKYVVCAYVSEIQGAVSYKANRILIAAKTDDNVYALNVPANLTLTTRYLSVDADNIVQGSSGIEFRLKNLALDQSFLDKIIEWLHITGYSSKTLQMDYERYTVIISGGGQIGMESQICRYEYEGDQGINLFTSAADKKDLLATYTTQDIEAMFKTGMANTVKTIDRYVKLECTDGSKSVDVGAWLKCTLYMYANYIYVDPSVEHIKLSSLVSSDMLVSSQESGYTTDNEYLGLFKNHSAESYSGTLLYLSNKVKVTYKPHLFSWSKTVELSPGFYFVAADDDGTSLTDIAEDPDDYRIANLEELKDYSVYIDPETGNLSNAYVDTGLFDNESAGLGGFSGGNMK